LVLLRSAVDLDDGRLRVNRQLQLTHGVRLLVEPN